MSATLEDGQRRAGFYPRIVLASLDALTRIRRSFDAHEQVSTFPQDHAQLLEPP